MLKLKSIFVILLFASIINAQEIGFSPTKIWSNNYEFQNPTGMSFYYYQPIWKIGVKLEYITAKNERNYTGYLVGGFLSEEELTNTERVFSKSQFHAVELSLIFPTLYSIEEINLNLGLGITFDNFKGERKGLESGRSADLFDQDKIGVFYALSISRARLFDLPVKIELLFKQKALASGNYATDVEQPFTGAIQLNELQFNIAFTF